MEWAVLWGLVRRWWPMAVCVAAVVAVLWMRADLAETKAALDTTKVDLVSARAELALAKVDAEVKERLAQDRVAETAAVAANERKLVDVIEAIPDTAPDSVRVALGCQRLRAQAPARPDSDLPLVCRSAR